MTLGFDPERLARIPAHVAAKYLEPGKLPHAALLIGRGDEIALNSVQGDGRAGEPLRENAIFRIASMTKPITSLAFMMLVEEGKVALNDPVHRILPEWRKLGVFVSGGGAAPFATRPTGAPMRMIDLLRHTAGLTYSFQERTPVDAAYRKLAFERFDSGDLETFVTKLAELPLEFDPGSAWNYSVATDVLGAIIQRLSGERFDQHLQRRILDPLGMVDTHFQLPAEKLDRMTDCWQLAADGKLKHFDDGAKTAWAREPKWLSGGGGLVSTVADYHRFCRMLLNGGALGDVRLVSPHTLKLMTANHLPGGGDLTQHSKSLFSEAENAGAGFGLGFGVTIDPVRATIAGNAGEFYWGGMYSTFFFVDPVDHIIAIFMTQFMPSSTYPIRRELKTMIYAALT